MINFLIFDLKNIIKNILKLIIIVLFVIGIVNLSDSLRNVKFSYLDILKKELNFNLKNSKNKSKFEKMISSDIPVLATGNKLENNIEKNEKIADITENIDEKTNENIFTNETEKVKENNIDNTDEIDIDKLRNLKTQVISENNLSESFNVSFGNVKIKNESKYQLTNDILTPNVEYKNKDVLIFHTHTCESYTQTPNNSYVASRKF